MKVVSFQPDKNQKEELLKLKSKGFNLSFFIRNAVEKALMEVRKNEK